MAGYIGIELQGAPRDVDCVMPGAPCVVDWPLFSFWLTQAALHPGVAAVSVLSLLEGLQLIPVWSVSLIPK